MGDAHTKAPTGTTLSRNIQVRVAHGLCGCPWVSKSQPRGLHTKEYMSYNNSATALKPTCHSVWWGVIVQVTCSIDFSENCVFATNCNIAILSSCVFQLSAGRYRALCVLIVNHWPVARQEITHVWHWNIKIFLNEFSTKHLPQWLCDKGRKNHFDKLRIHIAWDIFDTYKRGTETPFILC